MALPMNSAPVHSLTLPSTGKVLKYRPFLIKEEKTLLLAQQSESINTMVDSLKQVIQSCLDVKSNQDEPIDVDQFASFDLEYVFTQIRAKSVGEIVDLYLKCDTCEDEKAVSKVSVDLTKIQVEKNPNHTNKIDLYDDVGIVIKYPTVDVLKRMEQVDVSDLDAVFDIVVECIDYIYTTEEVFHAKEQSKEELVEFLNNLSSEQFSKIQNFFETMPRLRQKISYECPVCGKKHDKTLEGLTSFF